MVRALMSSTLRPGPKTTQADASSAQLRLAKPDLTAAHRATYHKLRRTPRCRRLRDGSLFEETGVRRATRSARIAAAPQRDPRSVRRDDEHDAERAPGQCRAVPQTRLQSPPPDF